MWPPAAGPVAIPRQTLSHIDCTFGAVAACWPTVTAGAARFTKVRRALYIVRLAVDAVAVRRKNWLG